MTDYLVENLRGMCAFTEPYGRCDQCRELRDFCTPCYAAAEIERLRAALRSQPEGKELFEAGWLAAKRDEDAGDDEDVADAPDVAFLDYTRGRDGRETAALRKANPQPEGKDQPDVE